MDSFAPEFSRFWLPMSEVDERLSGERRDDEAKRQREALEQLAERVTAARTIV